MHLKTVTGQKLSRLRKSLSIHTYMAFSTATVLESQEGLVDMGCSTERSVQQRNLTFVLSKNIWRGGHFYVLICIRHA